MKLLKLAIALGYPVLLVLASLNQADVFLKTVVLTFPLMYVLESLLQGVQGRGRRWVARSAMVSGMLALGAYFTSQTAERLQFIVFAQETLFLLLIGGVFGVSLRPGAQPLCERFARQVHSSMSPFLLRYCWRLTLAWSLFFAVCAMASVGLYMTQPVSTWVLFNSPGVFIGALIFLVCEITLRRFVLPPEDRRGIADTIRAIRLAQAGQSTPAH